MANNLTQYNRDKTALTNAESAQEVIDIAQKYALMASTYKKAKGYEEEYHKAFELMIEAYWILGNELQKILQHGGDRRSDEFSSSPEGNLKMSELGITG